MDLTTVVINLTSRDKVCLCMGDAVVSWLVQSSLERVVWVRALAGDIMLCSWERHYTLIHSFSLHPDVEIETAEVNAEVTQ